MEEEDGEPAALGSADLSLDTCTHCIARCGRTTSLSTMEFTLLARVPERRPLLRTARRTIPL